jgi:hypothetical protein
MNRRSLLALPLALVAAPAVASTGVFAWVERVLAKRKLQLVASSKMPPLTYDFSNTHAFADHRASSMTITTTRSDGLVSTMTLDESGHIRLTRSRAS